MFASLTIYDILINEASILKKRTLPLIPFKYNPWIFSHELPKLTVVIDLKTAACYVIQELMDMSLR